MERSSLHAMRAIAAVFIRNTLGIIATIITALAAIGVSLLAAQISEWWLLALVPLGILLFAAILFAWLVFTLAAKLAPRALSHSEKKQIKAFNNRLAIAAASAQLSRIAFAYLLLKDAFEGRSFDKRLQKVIGEGRGIKDDFAAIRKLF